MLEIQERNMMGGERFHAGRSRAQLSAQEIRVLAFPDELVEGSFAISGGDGLPVSGFVCSSEIPMKVLTPRFGGTREEIGYRLDTTGFAPGDCVDGVFRVLTDQGEYELPYYIRIERRLADSSIGPIRNLTHYVNLARTNWQEAVTVFYSKEFRSLVEAEEDEDGKHLSALYRGLSARPGNEHNAEEFLIASGRKEPAIYEADCREISAQLSYRESGPLIRKIRIRRTGWGCTRIRVAVSGSFLSVSTPELREADFTGGIAVLSVAMDPERMHAGRNYGRITLVPAFGGEIVLPVTASWYVETALRSLHRREQRRLTLELTQEYLAFRGQKSSEEEFTERVGSVVRRMKEADRLGPVTALYQIHYLLMLHQGQDALWELQALCRRQYGLDGPMPDYPMAQFDLEEDLTYAYRMYLTIQCAQEVNPDSIEAAGIMRDGSRAIETLHRRNPDSFRITWLMLNSNPDYSRRPSEVLRLLQEHYQHGCRSPLLYMELWQMIRLSPTILYELGNMELQVLLFAARRGLLTDSVMVRVNDLAVRRKTFSGRLFRILALAYESDLPEHRRKETLESICTLLIRGNMTDPVYHKWYRLGVEQELSITRLLDYFMISFPEEDESPLPEIVLLYYSWQNTLPERQTAHLYRYILENREQYADLYVRYAERIDRFTLEELSQRRISPDLAVLYEQYLRSGRILSAEHAAAAIQAVFTCGIRTQQPDMHRAVLIYDQLLTEQYAPLENGMGYLPVYGNDGCILLENDLGERAAVTVPFTSERMMDCEVFAPPLLIYEVANPGFDLYLTQRSDEITAGSVDRWMALASNEDVCEPYRSEVRRRLMEYYESEGDCGNLCGLLRSVRPDGIGAAARSGLIRAMTVEGLYGQAFLWLCRFGTDGADADTMMRLADGIRRERLPVDREALSGLAHEAFVRGRYDSGILEELMDSWDGRTQELRTILEAAEGFELDTSVLARRMLVQMLFTGEHGVDRSGLMELCDRAGEEASFLADVLAQMSHFYFVCGEEMPHREFDRIADFGMAGVPLLDICRIAWLKERSEQSGESSERDQEITELFLADLVGQGVIFPFFRQFAGMLPALSSYADETLYEYRAGMPDPKARVLFHYAAERGGVREPYAVKEMKEMYEGVYVTGFLLFFGEQLHYYITDDAQEKNVVESGTLGQDARIVALGEDRFCRINEITMLTALGRDDEAIAKMDEYGRVSFLTSRLFDD